MKATESTTSFALYRCVNPATNCDYPFLGVNEDRSVLLALGDHCLHFEWDLPAELPDWLAHDFVATGEMVTFDLATVQHLILTTLADEADFLAVRYNKQLEPTGIEFSLTAQKTAEAGPSMPLKGRTLPAVQSGSQVGADCDAGRTSVAEWLHRAYRRAG